MKSFRAVAVIGFLVICCNGKCPHNILYMHEFIHSYAAKSIVRRTADCKPPHAQLTFTSSTVFVGITCKNITNSNVQQPFSGTNVRDEISVTFDNMQFEIDISGGSSSVKCFGCTLGAELVAQVTMLVGSNSCYDSHNEWALAVRKFFDLVVNLTPHVMSVDIGDNIEIRTMVPLLEVRLSDGNLVASTLPPTVDRIPHTEAPLPATNSTAPAAITERTTTKPTTSPTTESPPTTPGRYICYNLCSGYL